MDSKLLRGNTRDKGASGQSNLTGFLLKASKGDQTSPEGGQVMRNLFRYQG